jgi:hypothetical protein
MTATPFWKTYAFWILALGWLAAMGTHFADANPGPWALVIANGVAVLYAAIRCVQKRAEGATWKAIVHTSEFVGVVLTLTANLLESVSQLPGLGRTAVGIMSGAVVVLMGILRSISGTNVPPTDQRPSGPGGPGVGPLAAAVVLLTVLVAAPAQAQTPTPADRPLGGCIASTALGQTCFGPAVAITVGRYNLTTGKFSGGVIPGIGYGATIAADQWYQTNLSMYLDFKAGGAEPNQATPSIMVAFANYVRVGLGASFTEQSTGPAQIQWMLNFALGSDFGGPTPQQAYREQKARAAHAAGATP